MAIVPPATPIAEAAAARLPGLLPDSTVLLPNGWKLSPAGRQIAVGDLPLNLDVHPDGRYAIVTQNGMGEQGVTVVDLASGAATQTIPLPGAWLGIRFFDRGRRFAVSGGNRNRVYLFTFSKGKAALRDSIVVGPPWPDGKIWLAGLDVDNATGTLYVVGRESHALYAADLATHQVVQEIELPEKPYACLVSARHELLYVSLWGGAAVAFVDRTNLAVARTVAVGLHPSDLAESRDGRRLFVANANQNTVSVVDVAEGVVTETLSTALRPDAPPGSTPNALAPSEDGARLYIANADNNYLAVTDVSRAGDSRALGFIPVGWYPTAVRAVPGRDIIVVANGKGGSSRPNPRGPTPGTRNSQQEHIGSLLRGTLSVIPAPDAEDLGPLTDRVYANSLYRGPEEETPGQAESAPQADETEDAEEEAEGAAAAAPEPPPIPRREGDVSPIKHVFYVIKENRTYDQVLGDLPQGNGDPSLTLFPEEVTPNHHALACEFVLLDNFYVDAEVSADGHSWSMGAYATDYVEKSWPTYYGGHGGDYDFESGPLAAPAGGFLWDLCAANEVSYRSYGEFVDDPPDTAAPVAAAVPGLEGHVAPRFRGYDLRYSDLDRVAAWQREFDQFEARGDLPQLQIIRLPNDHTAGTRRGWLTPKAYVAQNDLALGLLVEHITGSRFWPESAIFVVEDDAQNGPDHVDAHRSVALVVSPYARRGAVDREMYSTSSILRTIELILGLPPMSQFDASATPLDSSFTATPDLRPYTHRPARWDLEERNPPGAYGQARSEEMNLSREDAAPDVEFNQIVWKSIRGADSVMPAPVRSAFVRVAEEGEP